MWHLVSFFGHWKSLLNKMFSKSNNVSSNVNVCKMALHFPATALLVPIWLCYDKPETQALTVNKTFRCTKPRLTCVSKNIYFASETVRRLVLLHFLNTEQDLHEGAHRSHMGNIWDPKCLPVPTPHFEAVVLHLFI